MTPRLTGIHTITAEEAAALVRRDIIGDVQGDQLAIDCGVLRSCLWALSGGREPVHVLRLLNLVVDSSPETLMADVPDESGLRSRLRNVLVELTDAGDVVSLANGRWLPAPTREVRLGTAADDRLLIGGFPTSLLPADLASKIQHRGAFRRCRGSAVADALAVRRETLESWVGATPADLREWVGAVLEGHYEPFTEETSGRRFSVYAPQIARPGAPQLKRWFDSSEKLSGRFLARRDVEFGMRQYRAVEIISGRMVRVMRLQLGVGDLRRLMYGLDLLAGNPVRVSYEIRGDSCVVVLRSEIPTPEQRFFAAMGELSFPPDKYYPRTWRFPKEYADEIARRLTALHVQFLRNPEENG